MTSSLLQHNVLGLKNFLDVIQIVSRMIVVAPIPRITDVDDSLN
jgi:hypothetical protein